MSVYVGIDVHRKRSQVAVAGQSGEVLANRNVPNGVEPILTVIGGLPPGTPAAIRGLLRDQLAGGAAGGLRVRPAPGPCAAVHGDRLGPGDERQGPARRFWPRCCGRTCCRRRGSPRPRSARCGRCCGTGWRWCGCGPGGATGSTPSSPARARTGRPAGTGPARAGPGAPPWPCPRSPAS